MRGLRYIRGTLRSLRNARACGETVCHYHVFNDLIAEMIVVVTSKLSGRRIVLTVHDVDSLAGHGTGKRTAGMWLYRLADRIIVHNLTSKGELEEAGVPANRIAVIPHGHYLDNIGEFPAQITARQALRIAPSAKGILFFGQIKDTKGLDLLIKALPKVASEVPNVLLLIAGRPWRTTFARYERMLDELNVRRLCNLHIGFVPDENVANYYAAADVVALPYRRIYQSGVLLMAMTCGRPVVVSDLPGMTEVVKDGVNGYVFEEGSREDLARVLIRALQAEVEGRAISARALEYIRGNHDWYQIGRLTAAEYRVALRS